ncbi:hypothetical protein [uncultured Bacteroides sp.]|uniref:hypothetical protein n=1 Tax=uncultured Bacteroides sp. TaxID=162156 RepID=UPI002AA74F0F|nr:hypothetical protein [uncultured Bacteroides sp.]
MKYLYLLLILSIHPFYADSQELTCRIDSVLDISNKIEYRLKNDTTVIINVMINNNSIQKEYYYLKDSESCNFIPKFILKFRNSFIFLSGTHQHYRLLTLFQLEANKIIVKTFENELMLESSNDRIDKIFFLYKGQPIIILIDNNNKAYIRLYKKPYRLNCRDIKCITIDSKRVIVSLENKKKKIMAFSDFKDTVGYE